MINILKNLALFFFPKQNKIEKNSASTEEQIQLITDELNDHMAAAETYKVQGDYEVNSNLVSSTQADTGAVKIAPEEATVALAENALADPETDGELLKPCIEQQALEENENTPNNEKSDDDNLEDQPEDEGDENTPNDEESSLSNDIIEIIAKLINNPNYAQSSELESLSEEFQKEINFRLEENPNYIYSSEINDQQLFSVSSGQCDDLDTCS